MIGQFFKNIFDRGKLPSRKTYIYLSIYCLSTADMPPEITCPADPPAQALTSGSVTALTFNGATATDDSGVTPTIQYTSNPIGVTFLEQNANVVLAINVGIGRTIVTATATDGNNNMATCTFFLTVTCMYFVSYKNVSSCTVKI